MPRKRKMRHRLIMLRDVCLLFYRLSNFPSRPWHVDAVGQK